MTLAGTRPPTVDEWDKYELHHRARLATKPGLTGMWQVSGRSNITDLGRMIEINDKVNCSGCTACYAVCPQSAIEMKLDEEGFKYPWVDKNRCVECGLCNSV